MQNFQPFFRILQNFSSKAIFPSSKSYFTEKRSLGFRGLRMPHWWCSFIPKFIFLFTILSLAALFVEVNFVRNEHHVLKMMCTCVEMFARWL